MRLVVVRMGTVASSVILVVSISVVVILAPVVVVANLLESCFLCELLPHLVELFGLAENFVRTIGVSVLAGTDAAVDGLCSSLAAGLAEDLVVDLLLVRVELTIAVH